MAGSALDAHANARILRTGKAQQYRAAIGADHGGRLRREREIRAVQIKRPTVSGARQLITVAVDGGIQIFGGSFNGRIEKIIKHPSRGWTEQLHGEGLAG